MKDFEKTAESLGKCREIKNEILRFGINQLEIQQLIKLLALELEDRQKMIAIKDCIEKSAEKSILIPED